MNIFFLSFLKSKEVKKKKKFFLLRPVGGFDKHVVCLQLAKYPSRCMDHFDCVSSLRTATSQDFFSLETAASFSDHHF